MTANKRILITGATGNIGSNLSHHLATRGYDLVLTARSTERLIDLLHSINHAASSATQIDHIESNFCDPQSLIAVSKICEPRLDGIVLLTPKIKPTTDCLPPDEHWAAIFKESFIGPLSLIRDLIPILKLQKKTKIVIVSGISSTQVLSHYAHSNAIRAAWLAQAKTLAFALGPDGIHLNTLSLGGVMTDSFTTQLMDEARANGKSFDEIYSGRVDNVPLKKYAALNEVAVSIEGLLSSFTDHITGANLICDGGFSRAY